MFTCMWVGAATNQKQFRKKINQQSLWVQSRNNTSMLNNMCYMRTNVIHSCHYNLHLEVKTYDVAMRHNFWNWGKKSQKTWAIYECLLYVEILSKHKELLYFQSVTSSERRFCFCFCFFLAMCKFSGGGDSDIKGMCSKLQKWCWCRQP